MAAAYYEEYHTLLLEGDPLAEWEQLVAGMEAHNLRFGQRYISSVLRPLLLDRTRFEGVLRESANFFSAIRTLYGWLMEDERLRARMGLSAIEEAALWIEPGFPSPDGIGRLDGFLDRAGTLRFVEYNADSPGGLAFGHALADLYMRLPTMTRFASSRALTPVQALGDVLATLRGHYHTWGGTEEHPTIAIVDWEGLGTAPEFVLCREWFELHGCPSFITHPAALEMRDGKLWDQLSGQKVDIVYKRVLVGELLDRLGLENVLTEAMRGRAACVVNSYRAQLLFKKTLFALLSEMADDGRFAPRESQAIRDHLPWTRIVQEGMADYHSQRVDLTRLLLAQPERFVLKPNSEYGGKGVVLGWEVPAARWEEALTAAMHHEQPWVAQERIELATEPFPLLRDGALVFEERFMDLDPYTFGNDRVAGAGVRLGATGLLNVTAGGGSAVPLILVD